MLDIFSLTQMIQLIHAPICLYDHQGNLVQMLEDADKNKLITKDCFDNLQQDYPNLVIGGNGVSYCLLWNARKHYFVGIGKLRIYDFGDEEACNYPFCGKDEFLASVSIIWKMITGKEIKKQQLLEKNVETEWSIKEQLTKDIFKLQEEGRGHNPYHYELRVRDSIRLGDVEGLKQHLDEVYSGKVGTLAGDMVRQAKNIAICTITLACRSAIEGGITAELAYSMSDTFIRNIEDHLTEPVKIEKAEREAQIEFATQVHNLRMLKSDNTIVNQVRDYVFNHVHDAILVRDIAEYIGVTPNYLSEQFSQAVGIPLKQYIINQKIITSEKLLKYTDYSLQEISNFCAFSSQSRFSVYFQRKNGVTPAKYRKQFRNMNGE